MECTKRYILSKPIVPSCMNCGIEWSYEFITKSFPRNFITGEYKTHRENFLFDQEKARMPEAVQIVSMENERDALLQEIEDLRALAEKKQREANSIHGRIMQGTSAITLKYTSKACPAEGCRGMLDKKWKCGLCTKTFCAQCHELREDGHECDPDTLLTAKLIHKDSRPCPNCKTYIYKIDGCMQMWCTECKTAFNWVTGQVITQNIHNPHFFEAQRLGTHINRDNGDIPCGGLPAHYEFLDMGFLSPYTFPRTMIPFVCNLMGRYPDELDEPLNIESRKKYIRSEIDEKRFKRNILAADKKYHKVRELSAVYQMVTTTVSDILRQIVVNNIDLHAAREEICAIINYANGALEAIFKRYKNTPTYIKHSMEIIPETRFTYERTVCVYKSCHNLQVVPEDLGLIHEKS